VLLLLYILHTYRDHIIIATATVIAIIHNSAGGNCIYMSGRALHVLRAVDKAEAGRLSGAGETARKDKRNLYLANEGLLVSDSPYFNYVNI
jgi:hypothetical protein